MTVMHTGADEALQFSWYRYEGGHRWQKAGDAQALVSGPFSSPATPADERDWVLTNGRPAGAYEVVAYRPPADLFLKFANVAPTKEGIRDFANGYGLLGLKDGQGRACIIVPGERSASGSTRESGDGAVTGWVGEGELLSAWRVQIDRMRMAVELWKGVREAEQGSDRDLRRYIQWQGPGRIVYKTPEGEPRGYRRFAVISSLRLRPEILRRFAPGSVVGPAQHFLQSLINNALEGLVSPKLLWNLSRRSPGTLHGAERKLALFFVPRSLLGHMWLQLAEAVVGHKAFRRCRACGKWIVVGAGREESRASRLTCSNTCRMHLYQERMKRAAQMFAEGRNIEQIARKLGADPDRVRRWVRAASANKTEAAGPGGKRSATRTKR